MADEEDPCIEIRIGSSPTPLWMRRSRLDRGEGAIMPEPNHDENWLADSYAHLCDDGKIRRYHSVIGERRDIVEIAVAGNTEGDPTDGAK